MMKKFVAYFSFLLMSLCSVPSFAGDHELVEDVKVRGDYIFERYQIVANCFGTSLNSDDEWISTTMVSYDVSQTQIAFFKDGFIITFLSGENEGKQIVVCQDKIVGVSYPCEKKNRSLKHSYVWGDVISLYRETDVHVEDVSLFQALIEVGKH